MEGENEVVNRWRLILGRFSQNQLEGSMGDGGFSYGEIDDVLDFLYNREYGEDRGMREGSLDDSQILIPEWLRKVRKLFPVEGIEKIENHALERYNLVELLNDKSVLEKLQPNMNLLKNILALKNKMNGDVLETARGIVKAVADDIACRLENDVRKSFTGKINKNKSSLNKCSKNLDFRKTINKNLRNYDSTSKRLVVDRVYFNQNIKRFNPWDIIIVVDESGSMMESVIHSAVMAGIFAKLPVLRTKLVIFDTQVVDLSGYVEDPVQTLMSVQLGGGTDIGKALSYCENLIVNPYKTIVVLVSDLCDGAGYTPMYKSTKNIVDGGSKFFAVTSLDPDMVGMY
ncbi:MAG: VWA domain-containing protein, partial [Clostridiales bacterium]|nr:VWA domain-containing protein [Clostridiales bacterium]